MEKQDKILMWTIIITGIVALSAVIFCSFEKKTNVKTYPVDEDNRISFHFENIKDIEWNVEDNCWILLYNDPDVFDYRNLADITEREEWYGDYIRCEIESDGVIHNWIQWKYFNEANEDGFYQQDIDSLNNMYYIEEKWIESITDYIFTVKKK